MIEKISIQNFRSIKDLTIEPEKLTAIVGPNSTGKTNVLKALSILLGETYPTERAFSKDDFFNRNTNETISIQVWFTEPLRTCNLTSRATNRKAQCTATSLKLIHTKNPDAYLNTQFFAYDLNGEEYYASGLVRDQVCFVYLPSDRHLEKQIRVNEWTLLGKILKEIDKNFRKKEADQEYSDTEIAFREAMATPKEILESEFNEDLNFKIFKDLFIETCKNNTKGLTNNFELDLEIYDPLFYYKTIQIIGKEETGSFALEELGSGVQNLVLLSLFRTYAKLMKEKAILAIEEPEIFLHPQAQRQLYKNFRELAYPTDAEVEGTQIFYTTHNPSFVDAFNAHEIELLYKDPTDGTKNLAKNTRYLTPETAEKNRFKIYTQFNNERNELFFANKILLVEGHSDKILWSTIIENKWSIDIDKEGISIIECGGKAGVLYFLGVCKLLGFNRYFGIWDEDDKEHEITDSQNILPSAVSEGKGMELPGNLETFLRGKFPEPKYSHFIFSNNNKVENAFNWASNVEIAEIPEEFSIVKSFVTPTQTASAPEEDDIDWDQIPF